MYRYKGCGEYMNKRISILSHDLILPVPHLLSLKLFYANMNVKTSPVRLREYIVIKCFHRNKASMFVLK